MDRLRNGKLSKGSIPLGALSDFGDVAIQGTEKRFNDTVCRLRFQTLNLYYRSDAVIVYNDL